jgi:hypothetical protein
MDGSSNQNACVVIPCAFDFGEFNLKRPPASAGKMVPQLSQKLSLLLDQSNSK